MSLLKPEPLLLGQLFIKLHSFFMRKKKFKKKINTYISINPKVQYGMESCGLNTAGILNIHKNLAVCYFTSKHTNFGIPQAIKSLSFQQLSSSGGPELCICYPWHCYKTNSIFRCALYACPSHSQSMDDIYICSKWFCIYTKHNTYQHGLFKKKQQPCNAGGGPVV